jgi:hypothetical protein
LRAEVGTPNAQRGSGVIIVRLADHLWQPRAPEAKSKDQ